jgi:hypothetical protein
MNNEFEWEAAYNKLLDELPLEGQPSALLEERTVRELRRRGLLRRQRWLSAPWLTGAVAASIALFASGVAVGQWMGTRTAATIAQNNTASVAAQVQRTGSAYVQALEALVNSANQLPAPQQSAQAREVALTALHAAANEVVRLAPNDPVATKILLGIEQARRQSQPRAQRDTSARQIVWF